jgi:ribosomal-protein-alanine N-acetyltransferase
MACRASLGPDGPVTGLASPPPRDPRPRLDELDLVLVTDRLRLRPLREADVEDLWAYVSDPALPRLMSWHAHTERSETLAFIRRVTEQTANQKGVTWALEHAGRAVGTIGLDDIEFEMRAWRLDRGELGYWIAPSLWGQGLVSEAARAVVSFGFEVIGLHKVTAGCVAENAASRRVIEKLGFRSVGRLEDDVWRDGRWWSVLRYELTTSEWGDVSTTLRVHRPRST